MAALGIRPIKGVLCDITGVLIDGGAHKAIEQSVAAVKRLRSCQVPFRFVTNETQRTKPQLVNLLRGAGIDVYPEEIVMCVPAAMKLCQEAGLRPHVLCHPSVAQEFNLMNRTEPNCVIIGDAGAGFTYKALNEAFHILKADPNNVLISLGKSKYYKEDDKLVLDVGAYTTALEYAIDRKAVVVGKPSDTYFKIALDDLGIMPADAVMIGDDLMSDVGGAQATGMRGILVRTGKYKSSDEDNPNVTPDYVAKNLYDAVDRLLKYYKQPPPHQY